MNRCNRCNVTIPDDTAVCPVCRGALTKEEPKSEKMIYAGYPEVRITAQKHRMALPILLLLSVTGTVLLLLIGRGLDWSLIGVGAIVLALSVTACALAQRIPHQTKLLLFGFLAEAFLLWLDFVTDFDGWSVSYGAPLVLLALNGVVLLLVLARHHDWVSYALTQLRLFWLGVILDLLGVFGVAEHTFLILISVAVTDLLLLGMLVIGNRSMVTELKRLFRA